MLTAWKTFHATHGHPYLVHADLPDAARRQKKFSLLGTLLNALKLPGDFALLPDDDVIRIAFEREADAHVFVQAVGAQPAARAGNAAGQWAFAYDLASLDGITALLPPPVKRARAARVPRNERLRG